MNTWESAALQYHYRDSAYSKNPTGYSPVPHSLEHHDDDSEQEDPLAWKKSSAYDPCGIIYPGLYSVTGFDLMSILIRVATRSNPQIHLGPIDGNCALVLCDLSVSDNPIVYANDSFCALTGYTVPEVLGRNCRFLQAPPPGKMPVPPPSDDLSISSSENNPARSMRDALWRKEELQLEVVNFKKNGSGFVNMLSMVPISWGSQGGQLFTSQQGSPVSKQDLKYCVGFQADRNSL